MIAISFIQTMLTGKTCLDIFAKLLKHTCNSMQFPAEINTR